MNERKRIESGMRPMGTIPERAADELQHRLASLFANEPNAEALMEDAALLVDDLKTGKEPNFDWVPKDLRMQVISEWTGSRDRLQQFLEMQKEMRQSQSVERKQHWVNLNLQETAEKAKRIGELEQKFGEIPEEGTPIPQRKIATQIVPRPTKRSGIQRFFDRLAGNG